MSNSGWSNDAITELIIPTGATSGARIDIGGSGDVILIYDANNNLVESISPIAQTVNGVPIPAGFATYSGNTTVGARIVIDSANDSIEVYDASNNLIFYINQFGIASSNNPTTGVSSQLQSGQLEIIKGNTNANLVMSPAATTAQQASVELFMSPPVGTTYGLTLYGGSDDGSKKPTLVGNERSVQGSMVQSDQRSTNNLMHVASYTGSVTDAFGDVLIAHGASFTPSVGVLTSWDYNSSGQHYQCSWFQNPFTFSAGNMAFFVRNQTGGIPAVGTTVGVHAVLFG